MVTSIPTEPVEVTQIMPIDLTGVRDPGMRALVLLAASLGWNIIQKINNPVAIVARDGMQRRLPTNTSIRMSVFQTALSSIIAHTEDRIATPELIDAIVRETKLDRDHERRLRLAIGESAEEHRQRLANDKVAEQKREPEEHLTQHIEVPEEAVENDLAVEHGPHDGVRHGRLMSRSPFVAHHTTSGGKTQMYVSDTSLERVWQDGYMDYECMTCGRVYGSPKGVGAHSQVHTKAGEKDNSDPAWRRGTSLGADTEWSKKQRRSRAEVAAEVIPHYTELEFEEPPPENMTEVAMEEVAAYPIGEPDMPFASTPGFGEPAEKQKPTYAVVEIAEHASVIDQIAALVSPQLVVSRDMWKRVAQEHEATIDQLHTELEEKSTELDKLRADWDALRGLIDGR